MREGLEVLQKAFHLQFREDDYELDHNVQFLDASQAVFSGLHTLLDGQVAATGARPPSSGCASTRESSRGSSHSPTF